jgi:hypothetical protein
MTDDFHLFADPDDGEGPIDPDLALVSAYLARELSPMQVLALEERLATDSALRERVQPLIDAWSAPVASLEGGLARRVPPLSDMEKAESWRRFQLEEPNDVSTIRRRSSMTRIAAGIALIVLPMATLAQVVVYAANHADVPGHALAQRIVAPFVRGQETRELGTETGRVGANAVAPVPAQQTVSDSPSPSQIWNRVPAGDPGADRVQRVAADLAGPVIATPPQASTVQRAKPDRAKIAALAKQHAPAVVRGDTAADYVLMVLDAADRYVWSTHGIGSLSIEVAGDTRTSEERAEFTREHRAELEWRVAAALWIRGVSLTLSGRTWLAILLPQVVLRAGPAVVVRVDLAAVRAVVILSLLPLCISASCGHSSILRLPQTAAMCARPAAAVEVRAVAADVLTPCERSVDRPAATGSAGPECAVARRSL